MNTELNSPNMNLDKMWEDFSGDGGLGVHGYILPKHELNCAKERKKKDYFAFLEKVWKGKEKYPKAKENYDKDGKLIPVKRPNYFDDLFKSMNFGYSKEKDNELKELYSRKSRPISIDPNKIVIIKDKNKAKYYKHDRITYFESLVNEVKKGAKIYPHMESIIEKAKENIKNSPKQKSISESLKVKYDNKGSLP